MSARIALVFGVLALAGCQSGEPLHVSAAHETVAAKVTAAAVRQNVPVKLALAVTHVESRFRCNAVGPRTGSGHAMGAMQILPSSARGLFGFSGAAADLLDCDTGIDYGMRHLALCWDLTGHDYGQSARCYVAGPMGLHNHSHYANAYVHWVLAAMQ